MKFVEVFRHSKRGEGKGLDEIGGEIGFCEGVVFTFEKEALKGVELKRLPRST